MSLDILHPTPDRADTLVAVLLQPAILCESSIGVPMPKHDLSSHSYTEFSTALAQVTVKGETPAARCRTRILV